jgi:hypothetical protein
VQLVLGLFGPAAWADPAEMSVAAAITTKDLIGVRASVDMINSLWFVLGVLVSG